MNAKVSEFDCKLPRPNKIRAVVSQLSCIGDDWQKVKGRFEVKRQSLFDAQIDTALSLAQRFTADLLLFPELGISPSRVDSLRVWSSETGSVVIAGSHYFKKEGSYISRSPIIVAGEVQYVEKIVPSPHEVSAIAGKGIEAGEQLLVFRNSPVGDFGVLICSDFLDSDLRKNLASLQLDLLCVPAFQRKATVYHDRIHVEVEESTNGIFILLANMLCAGFGDGKSSIFALMDTNFAQDFMDEGLTDSAPATKIVEFSSDKSAVAVELDLENKRPSLPRTVHSRPNVVFLDSETFETSSESNFVKAIAHDDDRYRLIDELFVPPVEFEQISENLHKNRMVFITGDPGIGKTYTAAKLLREYFDRDYEPIWFTGLEKEERKVQRQVLENFRPKDKQIIYFEDPFGRVTFERRDAIFTVFRPLNDKLRELDAFVIVTSRKSVFETFVQESLSGDELEKFRTEMSIASPSYSCEKMNEMLTRLASISCKWWQKRDARKAAKFAIESGVLQTPMAIRDLVMSSSEVTSIAELKKQIGRRGEESARSFAYEISDCSFPSRLALLLVFLMGNKHQFAISAAFDKLAKISGRDDLLKTTFIQELRLHLGHRVEQFGSKTRGFRFLHPLYEESLAFAMNNDIEVKEVVKKSADELVNKYASKPFLDGLFRHVSKYPGLCVELIAPFLTASAQKADVPTRTSIASNMVGVVDKSKDAKLLELFNQLTTKSDLLNQINSALSATQIAKAIQVSINWLRLNGEQEDEFGNLIAWDSLVDRMASSAQLHASVEILDRLRHIRPELVKAFLAKKSLGQLMRHMVKDPKSARRLAELTSDEKVTEAISRANTIRKSGSDWANWINDMMSETPLSNSILVDRGAARAVKIGYGLLPVGIVSIEGDFSAGDPVWVKDPKSKKIAFGIAEYGTTDLELIKGHHSSNIVELCGSFNGIVAVRKNRMFRPKRKRSRVTNRKKRGKK